jgi:hypothetical protein
MDTKAPIPVDAAAATAITPAPVAPVVTPAPAVAPATVAGPPDGSIAISATTAHTAVPAPAYEPAVPQAPAMTTTAAIASAPTPGAPIVESKAEEYNLDEPQSALTAKFTAEEWKALREFRVRALFPPPFLVSLLLTLALTAGNAVRGVRGELPGRARGGVRDVHQAVGRHDRRCESGECARERRADEVSSSEVRRCRFSLVVLLRQLKVCVGWLGT